MGILPVPCISGRARRPPYKNHPLIQQRQSLKPLRLLLYEMLRKHFAELQQDTLCDRSLRYGHSYKFPHLSTYMQKVGKRIFPDSYSYIIPADAAKVPFFLHGLKV